MSQLSWHVRQVPAQTVWLTATLPPALQEEFIQQNKLVRPRVVRESTNRSNIKYAVSRQTGPGTLVQKAATLAKICWRREEVFNSSQD